MVVCLSWVDLMFVLLSPGVGGTHQDSLLLVCVSVKMMALIVAYAGGVAQVRSIVRSLSTDALLVVFCLIS